MPGLRDIHRAAEVILADRPDPVVRFRLLRDVLGADPGSAQMREARKHALQSRWIGELAAEQRIDGSWGRLHSVDTSLKQKNGTTEGAVARAVQLGLDRRHPILRRASKYIVDVLHDRVTIPDYAEKNERWPTGVKLFAASTLARFDPRHPALRPLVEMWRRIACETFADGSYDPDAEAAAHLRLTGIRGELRYLHIYNAHIVRLLGAGADKLPRQVEDGLLRGIFNRVRAMTYADVDLRSPPTDPRHYVKVLLPLEIVALLPRWRGFAKHLIAWLWSIRGKTGLWDFPPAFAFYQYRPLSENWRKPNARRHDSSVRLLTLLRKYYV